MSRKRRLHLNWFDPGMSDSEKTEREQTVLASEHVLRILQSILKKDLATLDKKVDYTSPAWQYEIALDNGQKKKINDLLTLLTPVIGE